VPEEGKSYALHYKKGFEGNKTSICITIGDCSLERDEVNHYIDDDGIIHLRCPRLEAILPKKTSKVEVPGHTVGACSGFTFASIEGSPSVQCAYGIERRASLNAYYNKQQWLKCYGCTRLNSRHERHHKVQHI
jgi:hypothetical protein